MIDLALLAGVAIALGVLAKVAYDLGREDGYQEGMTIAVVAGLRDIASRDTYQDRVVEGVIGPEPVRSKIPPYEVL